MEMISQVNTKCKDQVANRIMLNKIKMTKVIMLDLGEFKI